MQNPFVYGEEVSGKSFINRKAEIKTFTRDIESNERIFLISPRRYGKTSLIVNLFHILKKKGWLTARIDLYKATSLQSFANLYIASVINAIESKPERWIRLIREFIPALRPRITLTASGEAELGLDLHPRTQGIDLLLDKLYNLPEKIARRHKKRILIAFDEFQEIRALNGEKIEKALRASIQQHHNVSYIFAGSKKTILYDMASSPSSAFYKMGKIIHLNKISEEDFRNFIVKEFSKRKTSISPDVLNKIFNLTEDIPYNIQFLCHRLWDKYYEKKKISIEDIDATFTDIVSNQTPIYISMWDNLTLSQRNLLKAIATSGGKNIFSHDFLTEHNLGPVASVQTSVNSLLSQGFLEKENGSYLFSDVFFKGWVERKT